MPRFTRPSNMPAVVFSLCLGLVLAATSFVVVTTFRYGDFIPYAWLPESRVANAFIFLAFGLVLAWGIYVLVTRFPAYVRCASASSSVPKTTLGRLCVNRIFFNRKGIAWCTLVIFLCWLPVHILMYPIAANQDFFNQIYQYQASAPTYYTTMHMVVDAEFIDHHPIFDTLIFGWFYTLGDAFGSQNLGLFLLGLFQAGLLAWGLAASCCYLERLGMPTSVRIAALVFAIFFPYYAPISADATKDTLYSIAFVPFLLCCIEAVRTEGAAFKQPKFVVTIVVLAGLCMLTKKVGIYVCVGSLLVLLLGLRRYWKPISGVLLASVLAFALAIPAALYTAFDVAPGGRQESLYPALQQTVTLLKQYPEEFSQQDIETIDKVIDVEKAQEKYSVSLADGVKNTFHTDATDAEIAAYLQLWVKGGLQHPLVYVKSLLMCSGRLVLPSGVMRYDTDITDEDHRSRWGKYFTETSEGFNYTAQRPEVLLQATYAMHDLLNVTIASIPVVGLLTTTGFYGGWVPLFCCAVVLFAKRRNCLALAPVIFSVLFLLISPGSVVRYVWNLVFSLIAMVGWMLYSLAAFDENSNSNKC